MGAWATATRVDIGKNAAQNANFAQRARQGVAAPSLRES